MFDVCCLFGKEYFKFTPIFGACGLVSPGIIWRLKSCLVFLVLCFLLLVLAYIVLVLE